MNPIIIQRALHLLWPLALLAAVFVWGHATGARGVRTEWSAANAVQAIKLAEAEARAERVTVKVVTEYVDRVKVVREKARTIVKEVPVYVTPEADAACVVPRGFVRVHDGAAENVLPGAAEGTDGAASGVALSAVAGTVADNYGAYHEVAERLKALQAWVAEQQRASKGAK